MAAPWVLSTDELRSILSLYHLDALEDFGGLGEGVRDAWYWVQVSGRRYSLRIAERRRVRDMVYERLLLDHLARGQLPVPRLLENVAKGTFTPWAARGRFVSLFELIDGRELGVFEVRAEHVKQVGRLAARIHEAAADFPRSRAGDLALATLRKRFERVARTVATRRVPATVAEDVAQLAVELARQEARALEETPHGTVHGNLTVSSVRWRANKLVGVVDFQLAATERLSWDLAVGMSAWCWQPSAEQRGGPSGRFDLPRARAFLQGYESVRPLGAEELEALAHDLRLVAVRSAISRLLDFELKPGASDPRGYKDYRHYMQRLRALDGEGGAEGLIAAAREADELE